VNVILVILFSVAIGGWAFSISKPNTKEGRDWRGFTVAVACLTALTILIVPLGVRWQ